MWMGKYSWLTQMRRDLSNSEWSEVLPRLPPDLCTTMSKT